MGMMPEDRECGVENGISFEFGFSLWDTTLEVGKITKFIQIVNGNANLGTSISQSEGNNVAERRFLLHGSRRFTPFWDCP
jgi:hypothetical protein